MNRTSLLPLVCVAALSAGATDAYYAKYLTGISTISDKGVPSAAGGSWATGSAKLAKEDGAVVFDTGDSGEMSLNVTASPADTNTIAKIEIESTLEDVGELSALTAAAQTAFAVCTNAYHAWNGASWVLLSEVPAGVDGSQVTNILVEICYQGASNGSGRKVRFTVGDTVLRPRVGNSEWVDLATTANNIAGVSISGSGTIKTIDASVMLGVASVGDVKYGTLGDAVTAAGTAAKTINVLRETSENVELSSGSNITISDPNKLAKGTITVPSGTTVKVDTTVAQLDPATNGVYSIPLKTSGGTVVVNLPTEVAQYKEVATSNVTASAINVTLQTKSSIVLGTKPDGSKVLNANETKLRKFLNTYANAAYAAANATSETLATALQADGANGLKLYQSYALGVTPGTPVRPVPVAKDTAEGAITLTIPALTTSEKSGDYNITYKAGSNTATNDAGAIAVPLTTGSHAVKILFN